MTTTRTMRKPRSLKVVSIVLTGRRWFRRTYGNTYCSVEICVNGKLEAKLGPTYGYGDYWRQMAEEWLRDHGYAKPKNESLRAYCERRGVVYVATVSDVARERDL